MQGRLGADSGGFKGPRPPRRAFGAAPPCMLPAGAVECRPILKIPDVTMRYIDAFNHFFPKRFFDGLVETPAAQKDMGKRVRGIPALYDIDERLRVVDSF